MGHHHHEFTVTINAVPLPASLASKHVACTHLADCCHAAYITHTNTPQPTGAYHPDLYNFHLDPSLTLGCGTWGSTSVSTNVGPQHLLNYKAVHERRENMLWFRVPPKVYFKGGSLEVSTLMAEASMESLGR